MAQSVFFSFRKRSFSTFVFKQYIYKPRANFFPPETIFQLSIQCLIFEKKKYRWEYLHPLNIYIKCVQIFQGKLLSNNVFRKQNLTVDRNETSLKKMKRKKLVKQSSYFSANNFVKSCQRKIFEEFKLYSLEKDFNFSRLIFGI